MTPKKIFFAEKVSKNLLKKYFKNAPKSYKQNKFDEHKEK
jgi:hypothetical protein